MNVVSHGQPALLLRAAVILSVASRGQPYCRAAVSALLLPRAGLERGGASADSRLASTSCLNANTPHCSTPGILLLRAGLERGGATADSRLASTLLTQRQQHCSNPGILLLRAGLERGGAAADSRLASTLLPQRQHATLLYSSYMYSTPGILLQTGPLTGGCTSTPAPLLLSQTSDWYRPGVVVRSYIYIQGIASGPAGRLRSTIWRSAISTLIICAIYYIHVQLYYAQTVSKRSLTAVFHTRNIHTSGLL